ncbi:hypothetical protein RRF57_011529 [Xylaria bambusicola]|uniref:Uncharacterized protein n=1 Tax=Xylaria bambusicola TaxID=326684 RepID=A0AAN7UTX2_9PEZI
MAKDFLLHTRRWEMRSRSFSQSDLLTPIHPTQRHLRLLEKLHVFRWIPCRACAYQPCKRGNAKRSGVQKPVAPDFGEALEKRFDLLLAVGPSPYQSMDLSKSPNGYKGE